jgi:iron complex transport system substrate-binding protein
VTETSLPDDLSSREIATALGGAHRGSSIYRIDHEMLARLRPDVILTQDLCDVCAVSYASVNDVVRLLDLPTRVVSLEPRTIGGILTAIDTVAALIGAETAATRLRADAEVRLAALPGPVADGPRVLFVEWLDPLMPGGHWVPEQIRYAGGQSLFLDVGAHSVPQPVNRLADAAPDVIVFGPCGFTPERTVVELDVARAWPGWSRLPAVRDGRVWVVDGPAFFNRPGPRVIDGAEILAAIVGGRSHPGATLVALEPGRRS